MRLDEVMMQDTWISRRLTIGIFLLLLSVVAVEAGEGRSGRSSGTISREYYDARALFEKVWVLGEATPGGGDGIGPLFNAKSCVECHNLGGTGGAGDNSKSVTILAALPVDSIAPGCRTFFQGELENLHPGFRNRTSLVLHHHSTSAIETERLSKIRGYTFVQTREELFALAKSDRSTPALFGAGKIDAISDRDILEAEARTFPDFPEIKGRVSRVRGARLGKFGWKGQTASLDDFILAACANELGLEVRGHHQPSLLSAKEFDASKLRPDLEDADLAKMVRFVANLPAPVVRPSGDAALGFEVFVAIGCATCHAPSLGGVDGLYSDLLLHDLGDRFRAFGGGYGGVTSEVVDRSPKIKDAAPGSGEAGPTEWRTTPLWGVAASAPYLHDGRASTLHDAIILHGGEAEMTSKRYAALSLADRKSLLGFLRAQVAPSQPGRVDQKVRAVRGSRR